MRGDWRCFICDVYGVGGMKGFYRHYNIEHR